MSRVPINCPHCGKSTRVDLSLNLSTQKCDRCGIRFSSVNTGLAGSREVQLTEPPEWRRAKTGDWEEEPDDAPDRPLPAGPGSRAAWIAAAAALVAVAATALALARRPSPGPPVQPMAEGDRPSTLAPEAQPGTSNYTVLRERIDAATVVARQYLSATSVDELLPLIENRETLEPHVRAYYTEGPGRNVLPLKEFTLAPTDRQVWVDALKAVVISYDTPGQVPRAVALRQAADGNWLVDWPSAAAFSDVPLARFRADRDTTPRLFRLLAVRDDYFNRAFASDQDWICLRLSDPEREHRFYGYVRKGTPAAESVLKSPIPKARSNTSSPVMLRLRFPEYAPSDDQVEIVDFLGMGWIQAAPMPAEPAPPTTPAPPRPDGP